MIHFRNYIKINKITSLFEIGRIVIVINYLQKIIHQRNQQLKITYCHQKNQ